MAAEVSSVRSASGWRWLDLRQLSQRILARRADWLGRGALVHRVVYCTAFIDGSLHPAEHRRQQVYVAALRANRSFDHLEEGRFTARRKTGLLATRDHNGRPVIHTDLAGRPGDGVGGHWWYRLEVNDFHACQLAGTVGNYRRPPRW